VREWGLEPLPGVKAWLERLRDAGVPCAIGSSTHRPNIDLSLSILGFASFFSAIVTGEDVTFGNPDPQVFLVAASRIQRSPECCVVFEDAFVGIEAAKAGGMRVIGVATTHPPEALNEAAGPVRQLDNTQ